MQMYAIFSIKGTNRHTKISTNYPPADRLRPDAARRPPEPPPHAPHPPQRLFGAARYGSSHGLRAETAADPFRQPPQTKKRRDIRSPFPKAATAGIGGPTAARGIGRLSAKYRTCDMRGYPQPPARGSGLHLNFPPPAHRCGSGRCLRLTAVTAHKLFIKQTK